MTVFDLEWNVPVSICIVQSFMYRKQRFCSLQLFPYVPSLSNPNNNLPGAGDAMQKPLCVFWKVRGHQDLHRVDLQDTSLQLRARVIVSETVQ